LDKEENVFAIKFPIPLSVTHPQGRVNPENMTNNEQIPLNPPYPPLEKGEKGGFKLFLEQTKYTQLFLLLFRCGQ
jgi:hypothetical protein